MRYSILPHAVLRDANLSGADLRQADLHRVDDDGANWKNANRKRALKTDTDLATAEDFTPPQSKESPSKASQPKE